jgi:ADP-heptose:LPS heptosyltransferase
MHVLVIRFSAIGDVALWIPVMHALVNANPTCNFTFLTRKNIAFFFKNIPNVTVIGVDVDNEYNGPLGLIKLAKKINNENKFDAIIDGHNVLRTIMLKYLLKAPIKVVYNKDRAARKKILAHSTTEILPHVTTNYLNAAKQAGLQVPDKLLEKVAIVKQVAFNNKPTWLNNNKLIGIAPFAKHKGKIWPTKYMSSLLKLLANNNIVVLLFGAKEGEELEQMQAWAATFNNIVLTTEYSFAEQIKLMESLPLMVTMDSANMHLAAIQGVKVISIWGATQPSLGFAPLNNEANIISNNLPCQPCSVYGNKPCSLKDEPYKCLNSISPEMVFDKINEILNAKV